MGKITLAWMLNNTCIILIILVQHTGTKHWYKVLVQQGVEPIQSKLNISDSYCDSVGANTLPAASTILQHNKQ